LVPAFHGTSIGKAKVDYIVAKQGLLNVKVFEQNLKVAETLLFTHKNKAYRRLGISNMRELMRPLIYTTSSIRSFHRLSNNVSASLDSLIYCGEI